MDAQRSSNYDRGSTFGNDGEVGVVGEVSESISVTNRVK